MNHISQNTKIATKSNAPKIISGIVTAISIALGWLLLPPFWFWVLFDCVAAMLVAFGCGGEWYLHHHPAGRKKAEKDVHHRIEARFIAMVSIGVTMEFFVLGHSIREGVRLEDKVSEANERAENSESNNLVLQIKIATLNSAVLQLAHQYDLSTNALAEANIRLSAIRPLKDRLIDCLDDIDPTIVSFLRAGKTEFELQFVPEIKFNVLMALLKERGSDAYCSRVALLPTIRFVPGAGETGNATIVLKPELAQ